MTHGRAVTVADVRTEAPNPAPPNPAPPIAAPPTAAVPDTVRVDPVAAAHAAGEVHRVTESMRNGVRPALLALELPPQAFGTAGAAVALASAHQVSLEDMAGLVGRLASVLEGDVDRLYRVAFAVQETERTAVQRIGATSSRGPGE
jgi:hypothetical protein